MRGSTHKLGGGCFGIIAIIYMISPPITPTKILLGIVLFIACLIGSLIPDIDHPNSKIGSKFKSLSKAISYSCGHRGATHAPIIHTGITLLLLYFNIFPNFYGHLYTVFVVGLLIGSLSHIFLDAFNPLGIPLLYPFTKKKFRLAKLKTGKTDKEEIVYKIVLIVFTLAIIKFKLF